MGCDFSSLRTPAGRAGPQIRRVGAPTASSPHRNKTPPQKSGKWRGGGLAKGEEGPGGWRKLSAS
ncbi:MAG: hypothetical protein Q9186_002782 [Xanthomendoza sp. 1 TL-2023]